MLSAERRWSKQRHVTRNMGNNVTVMVQYENSSNMIYKMSRLFSRYTNSRRSWTIKNPSWSLRPFKDLAIFFLSKSPMFPCHWSMLTPDIYAKLFLQSIRHNGKQIDPSCKCIPPGIPT